MPASDKEVRLKQVFSELDRKFEEEETQRKAKKNHLPFINLYGFPVDQGALALIPQEQSESLGCAVFYKEGRNLKLGILDKSESIDRVINELQDQSYFVEVFQISKSSFKTMFLGYTKVMSTTRKSQEINIDTNKKAVDVENLKDLAEKLNRASATEMIDIILGAALSLDSSDVHIEPEGSAIKIRYRIDGVLQDVVMLAKEIHHQLLSRIKILSKLKLNITTMPQDGSFSIKYNDSAVDIRVSVLPSAYGESLVLRLLRQDKGSLNFDDLGITGLAYQRLLKELGKPNGMILTTGPTGSGKTTTLYAILNKLNEPGIKIITLEDPVEYKIEGISQTPIDHAAGLTFAAGLRAVLRQDPDVVMVGEMRDLETSETAAQAALTGHIVLSTLHTNDAASAIPRLLDLGIKPFILAPAINAIIAQRLVRKICTKCKIEYVPEKQLIARVASILKGITQSAKVKFPEKLVFYHSPGCKACKGLGYKGRMGIYEIITMNPVIEQMIHKEAITSDIRNQAISDGMITMAQDGILKALAGVTDIEEVFRVTEE